MASNSLGASAPAMIALLLVALLAGSACAQPCLLSVSFTKPPGASLPVGITPATACTILSGQVAAYSAAAVPFGQWPCGSLTNNTAPGVTTLVGVGSQNGTGANQGAWFTVATQDANILSIINVFGLTCGDSLLITTCSQSATYSSATLVGGGVANALVCSPPPPLPPSPPSPSPPPPFPPPPSPSPPSPSPPPAPPSPPPTPPSPPSPNPPPPPTPPPPPPPPTPPPPPPTPPPPPPSSPPPPPSSPPPPPTPPPPPPESPPPPPTSSPPPPNIPPNAPVGLSPPPISPPTPPRGPGPFPFCNCNRTAAVLPYLLLDAPPIVTITSAGNANYTFFFTVTAPSDLLNPCAFAQLYKIEFYSNPICAPHGLVPNAVKGIWLNGRWISTGSWDRVNGVYKITNLGLNLVTAIGASLSIELNSASSCPEISSFSRGSSGRLTYATFNDRKLAPECCPVNSVPEFGR